MKRTTEFFKRLWKDESGATMVEYGLMLALIAVVCIIGVTAVGDQAAATFTSVGAELEPAAATQ